MSSGQIRSYISYIDIDSDDAYIKRIENLINEVTDPNEKQSLYTEFSQKKYQVEMIKKIRAAKEEENITPVEIYDRLIKKEVEEDFTDQLKNGGEELRTFLDNLDSVSPSEDESPIEEDRLPVVEAAPYVLLHLGTSHVKLYKSVHCDKSKELKYKMPTIPIINNAA